MPYDALRMIVLACAAALVPAAVAAQAKPAHHHHHHQAAPAAKALFGAVATPDDGVPAKSIGYYSRGCLAGAVALPITGPHWQVMRLSRNRNWGHPDLVRMIERVATELPQDGGWDGILVGDMSQPRGGPMRTGHVSHQVGLDVDVWLTPWPGRVLTREQRETYPPVNVVAEDDNDINPKTWGPKDIALIKTFATDPEVVRVLANPAVKKALCREVHGDRSWLRKVRPWYGHRRHVHVRIRCPNGDEACRKQPPPPPGTGCGKELAWWFTKAARTPTHHKPRPPVTLADLPAACRAVLEAK